MLKKSIDILNKNFLLILLMAITSLFSSKRTLSILGFDTGSFIASAMLPGIAIIIICGVCASLWQYSVESKYNFIRGIKQNLGHLFVVLIILLLIWAVPSMVVINLFKGSSSFPEFLLMPGGRWLIWITLTFFGILFIFVYPYVFVKGESAKAVPDGIKYLFKNFRKATLAIAITVCAGIVTFTLSMFDITALTLIPKITLLLAGSIVGSYLGSLSFLVACLILDSDGENKSIVNSQ